MRPVSPYVSCSVYNRLFLLLKHGHVALNVGKHFYIACKRNKQKLVIFCQYHVLLKCDCTMAYKSLVQVSMTEV